jgi:isocitrate dehydrogenase
MSNEQPAIVYTITDESPFLAACSLLPVLRTFAQPAGIEIREADISLGARILAEFSDHLAPGQRVEDGLAELARLTRNPSANIIKLPNISASLNQLQRAIGELQARGYAVPDYPEEPAGGAEHALRERYGKVLGSAVNPVLREGNSDRRAPAAVKSHARKHPHDMAPWSPASRTHVAHMRDGDFYASEKSLTVDNACAVRIDLVTPYGEEILLKQQVSLLPGEIIDSMFMSKRALCTFFEDQLQDAYETGVMFSLHVKATMMKVSHPIVFGHAVRVFYKDLFARHGELFDRLGVNPNNGISSVYDRIRELPGSVREEIEHDIHACYQSRPELAMVDPRKGISNLHAPNDVIVDASMPAMIRAGGKMWGPDGKLKDTKAVMPESTYARIYQEMINFCKTNGAFDPATMGTVPNVGLMAQKAEEYGSHDKTFEIPATGIARIVDDTGRVLLEQQVEKGDIWRMCQTKDAAVRDWVALAVDRARKSQTPAVFWLDKHRAHDAELIRKVETYLAAHDLDGLDLRVMSPLRGMRYTLERVIRGKDTISVTGNILRDYLTDLFPIMELGTSAKMLSVVPLMQGGHLFETGAGGTAPKLVQQLLEENHLSWDSLGEFLALAESLAAFAAHHGIAKAGILGRTLEDATARLLEDGRSPSPKTGGIDNRGSHFYLALYWAEALAEQTEDAALRDHFTPLARRLAAEADAIIDEMRAVQGQAADLGGYFCTDAQKTRAVMRPSARFNDALAQARASD